MIVFPKCLSGQHRPKDQTVDTLVDESRRAELGLVESAVAEYLGEPSLMMVVSVLLG